MRRRIRGILMSGKQYSLDSRMDLVQGFSANTTERTLTTLSENLPLMKEDLEETKEEGIKDYVVIKNEIK